MIIYEKVELPLLSVLTDMECEGIKKGLVKIEFIKNNVLRVIVMK